MTGQCPGCHPVLRHPQRTQQGLGTLTAAFTVANSTTALPVFLLETNKLSTSPYCGKKERKEGKLITEPGETSGSFIK